MTNRRNFLRTSVALAAATMISPTFAFAPEKKVIGLQLYTVRDKIKLDLKSTLEKVAKIGYNSAEAAGYNVAEGTFYGMTPKAFAEFLNGLGMPLTSSHTTFELDTAEKVIADAASTGAKYIIYPFLADKFRTNLDGWKATAEKFNKMGEIAKKNGIQFGYHNHAFEFEKMEDQIPYDLLLSQTDPSLVTFEMDLYWVTKGGYNPVDYFKKYPGRFQLWHVKDMTKTDDMFFAPVGSGRIDFSGIFAEKKTAGMKYFFVEQDSFKYLDAYESIEMSFKYLSQAKFL
ncbi:sugar phosphate isomerase/epimerase [Aquipluma nitroreducens]|uniref:Sugar phosphate isomerase/epimerase n=1 Tax=Aquipluma nitroreducens TaxID=2010828 RepID=A0A5K7S3P9_9BACT|nr:TIM barrel protein [Aquipluma nitroreducens]BBE15974.1 sugar phosphate isomerase/epimerase [Aquipluma nitroreducens]